MDIDRYSSRGLECICGNLRMASRAVTSVYDSHLREAGLQASQMAVLWAVAGMPGSGIKDIAKRILEGRGWIAIDVGTDRRQRLPALTTAGREVFGRALPLWKLAQDQVAAVIEGNVKQINSQLLKLTRAVS
jgi:DNA-binding MarR family transcriptional regulator